jgi:pimeloyl-ACP methyl ester carboxylesterase
MSQTVPIVLIPGLFCTPRLYAGQIDALWKFGPVLIADHTRDDSMAAIAARLLESIGIARFALAGLSMGGYVALEVVRQAPQRVAKLALLGTSARADTPEQIQVRNKQIEQARAGQLLAVVEGALPLLVHNNQVRDTVKQMALDSGAETFARQQTAIMGRADSRPLLAAIRCPTLVLVGEQDRLIPYDRSKEIADGIAGSRLITVPDCGHLATLEQPQACAQALTEWLRTN